MVKVIVTAPKGKMGSLILEEAIKDENIEVIGAIGPQGRDYIGKEISGVMIYDDLEKIIDQCDVVIDFSNKELSMKVLSICVGYKKSLICGTTGFNPQENMIFEQSSKMIPILKAANTSFMVNVMMKLAELAGEKLSGSCKMEILDLHDEKKLDAPSGTAVELAEILAKAGDVSIDDISHHSVRAGDIPSSHTIYFGGIGERIEITHHAYNWRCYAVGACKAASFLINQKAGLYSMSDVIES